MLRTYSYADDDSFRNSPQVSQTQSQWVKSSILLFWNCSFQWALCMIRSHGTKTPCWMANEAVKPEKPRGTLFKKLKHPLDRTVIKRRPPILSKENRWKYITKRNPQLFGSLPTYCIYPATWNLSDNPAFFSRPVPCPTCVLCELVGVFVSCDPYSAKGVLLCLPHRF